MFFTLLNAFSKSKSSLKVIGFSADGDLQESQTRHGLFSLIAQSRGAQSVLGHSGNHIDCSIWHEN